MKLTLLLLLVAGLDGVFGDPHTSWHPVALFGRCASGVEQVARRWWGNSVRAGCYAWCLLCVGAVVIAQLLVWLASRWGQCAEFLMAGVILYFTVALRSLCEHAENVRRPLADGNLTGARSALSMMVSRDTENLEASDIARGAIESLGENLVDGVTSAYLWMVIGYLLGGVAGAVMAGVLLRAVNTLDACWGYQDAKYHRFGRWAARADDFMQWLPARVTLPFIALASAFLGGSFRETWHCAWRYRHAHPSPNSCWGMAAFAGALRVSLGGPTIYGGEVEHYPRWGNGRRKLTAQDIQRAKHLAMVSTICLLLALETLNFLWWLI